MAEVSEGSRKHQCRYFEAKHPAEDSRSLAASSCCDQETCCDATAFTRARQIIIAPCPHALVIGLEPSHTRPTRVSSHLTNFSKQDSRQPTHPHPSIPAIRAPSPHAHESVATLSCTPSQSRCHWSVDERTDGRTISGWCTDAECSSVQCADTGSAECADAGGCLSIKTSIGRQLRANSVCVSVHMGACAWERTCECAHGSERASVLPHCCVRGVDYQFY